MKVLFLEHVVNVAKPGEIKEVKPGYAQNMLFPKKYAVELTPQVEREMKAKMQKDEKHRMELIENRHKISEKINGTKLNFKLKTGGGNKVYGGIGEKDIIREIKKKFKIELTKKHIDLPDGHLKKIGSKDIYIKLGKDAMAKINIVIEAE